MRLYLYPRSQGDQATVLDRSARKPNIAAEFADALATKLNLRFVQDCSGDLQETFGPDDVFYFVYSVFHSPSYRRRYAEFLKIDFPRVPLTSDKKLFGALVEKGREMVALHLLESPKVNQFITHFPESGDNQVEKVRYEERPVGAGLTPARADKSVRATKTKSQKVGQALLPARSQLGRVYINKTQYFEGVPKDVWEFHIGGYQVCEKWLKDRKGRNLSSDDI